MTERFSKQALTEYIQKHINRIQMNWGFDPTHGTAQIPAIAAHRKKTNPLPYNASDHEKDAAIAYGELEVLFSIALKFDLEVSDIPPSYEQRSIGVGRIRYCPAGTSPRGHGQWP